MQRVYSLQRGCQVSAFPSWSRSRGQPPWAMPPRGSPGARGRAEPHPKICTFRRIIEFARLLPARRSSAAKGKTRGRRTQNQLPPRTTVPTSRPMHQHHQNHHRAKPAASPPPPSCQPKYRHNPNDINSQEHHQIDFIFIFP